MTDYLTEQEQIEILKNWIKQYSLVILAGVLIAVAAITGWRYWQQRQTKIIHHASAVYDEMLTKRAQNEPAATLVQAQKLFDHYSQTTYGQMAAFMLARDAITQKNYADGEKYLKWVLKKSSTASIREIARIRLARIYIAMNQSEQALTTLEKVEDKTFNGLIEEVKGDAYVSMHNTTLARRAYKQALDDLPNAETVRPLLQMKYDNLATT